MKAAASVVDIRSWLRGSVKRLEESGNHRVNSVEFAAGLSAIINVPIRYSAKDILRFL